MSRKFNPLFYIILFLWNFINPVSYPIAWADEIQAAVATNFHNPFKAVVKQFEKKTGHKVIIIAGSTGKLYAQIVNGAPFDIFLAADSLRPQLLIQEGRAISGTQYSYAFGKITLWSPIPNVIYESLTLTLRKENFSHISLIKHIKDRLGHDKRYSINSSKIKRELNWRPKVSFNKGIKKTIEWYLKNYKWK